MDKVWQAEWIKDPAFHGRPPRNYLHREQEAIGFPPHDEDLKNHHMLVRREFELSEAVEEAYIDISADDYYKLYVNGEFVGQGPADGYYFHYYYNRHQLTPLLQEGRNLVAVHVFYQGLVNRAFTSADYRQGLIAEVVVNGRLKAKTDRSWVYRISDAYSGSTTGYETQYLENIDARRQERGWKELGYDDSGWSPVWEDPTDDHCLYRQPTPPVAVYRQEPETVERLAPGHYLIDFGCEITGQFWMQASGEPGQGVEIRCGEELADSGRVRYEMRCGCTYREFWTLSGEEVDTLEYYDYKAFRYVEVIAPEGVLQPETFGAVVRHYPMPDEKCSWDSSDELINQIWCICRNGVKYGTQEKYMDCPTREKGQYLGDNTVIAHSQLYLAGDPALYRKSLQEFAQSARIDRGLMAVAPGSYMQEIADYSLQWPLQLWRYYQHSGDREFLAEMYPVARGVLEYFSRWERSDGLLTRMDDKWNLVDWPENLRDNYDFGPEGEGEQCCHSVLNAFYYGAQQALARIEGVLGSQQGESSSFPEAFRDTFYDPERSLFVDSEGSSHSSLHANVLPLYFDLAPAEAREEICDLIARRGLHCGVYMAYFVLKALARAGEYGLLWELLTSTDSRSWGNMLREGATTCFEAWGKEQKWNTSLCHPWASAPIPVLIEDIVGLKPVVPGWKEISFTPHIPPQLVEMELAVTVPTGQIRVAHKHGETDIQAQVPVR